jgi:putative transposase
MVKTYKYKLYPTKAQKQVMHETTFLCSLVYNQCLAQRKEAWEKEHRSISCYDQIKQLPDMREKDIRYQSVHSQVLQDTVSRVDKSFQNFFRRVKAGDTPGYPRFKSARRYDSFTYPQSGFKLNGRKLFLSRIGNVKIKLHRPIEGEIRTLTIHRQADGWFACVSCEISPWRERCTTAFKEPLSSTGKDVGIDVGLENFATTSDGEFFPPIKDLRKAEKKIKRLQREVARRKKGSKRRKKSVWRLKRAHLRVANKRRDTHHKVARKLVDKYDTIAIEDLSTNNMMKNHHLAKSISDAGWYSFSLILAAKAEEAGRKVVKVDPKFTSQVCSGCGAIVQKELKERWHSCKCGCELHRDVNAAINILTKANIKQLGEGIAFGDRVALAP